MATPTLAHTAVSVNFNIDISGNSSLNVFGEAAQQMDNVIVAEYLLPVDALYDTSSVGLIELWEDKDNIDDISVSLAHTDGSALPGGFDLSGAWQATAKKLAMGLENVLCKPLDCSGVAPFSASAYTADEEYYKPTDFGHVALGVFAHYMFGHVDATAAITNDKAFLKSMLSLSVGDADAAVVREDASGGADRVAAFTYTTDISDNGYVKAAWMEQSAADANLARRLAAAVIEKGFDNAGALNVTTVSDASNNKALLSNIVRQVVGQDATRLMNEDGSERTIDQHRLLRFYAGDVIYVNITIKTPGVTVGAGQRSDLTSNALQASYTEKSYAIKITLAPKAA
jgi:hypothetical protein